MPYINIYENEQESRSNKEIDNFDYNALYNKPKINGVILSGDKSTEDLKIRIPDISNLATREEVNLVDNELSLRIDTKQNILTPGNNITITSEGVISASDDVDVNWGHIKGTLSNQSDLISELNMKLDKSDVVEYKGGTSITIDDNKYVKLNSNSNMFSVDSTNQLKYKGAVVKLQGSAITGSSVDGDGNYIYTVESAGKTGYSGGNGIVISGNQISAAPRSIIAAGDNITITDDPSRSGRLLISSGVNSYQAGDGLSLDGNKFNVKLAGNNLFIDNGKLNVDVTGLQPKFNTGNGISLHDGELSVATGEGLTIDGNSVAVDAGDGLLLDGGILKANVDDSTVYIEDGKIKARNTSGIYTSGNTGNVILSTTSGQIYPSTRYDNVYSDTNNLQTELTEIYNKIAQSQPASLVKDSGYANALKLTYDAANNSYKLGVPIEQNNGLGIYNQKLRLNIRGSRGVSFDIGSDVEGYPLMLKIMPTESKSGFEFIDETPYGGFESVRIKRDDKTISCSDSEGLFVPIDNSSLVVKNGKLCVDLASIVDNTTITVRNGKLSVK